MPRKITIDPKTTRYKIAQFCLRVLYGRKWHHISPWKHGSIAGTAVLTKNNKVLMCRRRGDIEEVGIRDHFGGHLNLENKEEIIPAIVREVFEETCMKIDPSKITQKKLVGIYLDNNKDYIELKDARNICITYKYELNDEELKDLQETEESHDYKWFTKSEIEERLKTDLGYFEKKHFSQALKAISF